MPLYEYVCQSCRQPSELLVRGNEQPQCPSCGSEQLERQLSVPAAHVGGKSLPISDQGCGRPQCGSGRCMME